MQTQGNIISDRVQDFLVKFPPFHLLQQEDIQALAKGVIIQYYQAGDIVFKEGEQPGQSFYVVRKGAINLWHNQELMDQCDEGDILGIRSLIVNKPYIATAQCSEESLVYAIPNAIFEPLLSQYADVSLFFAAGFAAGKTVFRHEQESNTSLHAVAVASYGQAGVSSFATVAPKSFRVSTSPDTSIQAVAQQMKDAQVGSMIIVDDNEYPIGIVTDKDFRNKIGTGLISIQEPISTMMSSPVSCVHQSPTINEVMMRFMKHRFHHLCITEDGTDQSPLISVISDHDIMVEKGDNPASLLKKVRKATSMEELTNSRVRLEKLIQDYLDKDVTIDFVASISSEIEVSLIEKIITFGIEKLENDGIGTPPCSFAWLALGSQGRKEQLLRTDQDNALLYETEVENAKSYFLKLAEFINEGIEKLGFQKCPAGIMGSNPQWCLSLADWKKLFHDWIASPSPSAILNSTIFFDFRSVYGNELLVNELRHYIFQETQKNEIFVSKLAHNALLNPPPLSFFRNMLLEKDGEHKDLFDIKARAMVPLADIARVLAIQHQIDATTSTYERFNVLATIEKDKALFEDAALAYKFLMKTRTSQGIEEDTDGRYIDPKKLNKLRRHVLRTIFDTIHELQSLLKVRFRTTMMN